MSIGIPESDRDSTYTQASTFFKTNLKLNKLAIDVAYRMGKPLAQGSMYKRPIVVKFSQIADRNSVWKKRNDIAQDDQNKPVRIQAA